MTKRALWLVGIAIVLAVLCIRIERIRHRPATPNVPREVSNDKAATHAPTLADIFAPVGAAADGSDSDQPRVRLEGLVLSIAKEPVAGATVRLGARTTVTDTDGSFAFDDVAQALTTVSAEKGELYGEDTSQLSETSDPIELTIRSGPLLIVHVLADATGAPIAGAAVDANDRAGVTDATGTVRLRTIASTSERLWIKAKGFAEFRGDVLGDEATPTAPIEMTIRLKSGALLRGIVRGPHGELVPDVRIRMHVDGDSTAVYAEEDGTWVIEDAPAGLLEITAAADDYVNSDEVETEHDGIHPTTGIVLTLKTGAELAGIVVDRDGNPVEGASLSGVNATTGPDGRFLARGLDEGTLEIRAMKDDSSSAEQTVAVSLTKRAEIQLVLEQTSIVGVVVDPKGNAIADATVYAYQEGTSSWVTLATSDEFGTFSLDGLPPGHYELEAQFAEEGSRSLPDGRTGPHVRSGQHGVRIVLAPLAKVLGRVTLDGRPVEYFGVSISSGDNDERPEIVNNPSGAFAQTNIAAGSYTVSIAGPDSELWTKAIVVPAGGAVDLGTIALSRGRIVRGHVVDHTGAPIAHARVAVGISIGYVDPSKVGQRMSGYASTISDAYGAYELVGVGHEDLLDIGAKLADGRESLERDLEQDETVVDLVIPAMGVLDGVAPRSAGERLFLYSPDIAFSALISVDDDGHFHSDNIPVGTYQLGLSGRTEDFIMVTVSANRTTSASYTPAVTDGPALIEL